MKKYKILLLLLVFSLTLVGCKKSDSKDTTDNTAKTEENKTKYSPLDGSIMKDSDDNYVVGVMLDNHPEARPQSGFNKASIVYEFRVEGDMTRYLALFYNTDAEQIGPVRSARPYFVQTIAEYNGIYGHFGGSTLGIQKISELGINNLNGMELEGTTFYRNSKVKKSAPHNAYTSTELLNEAIDKKGYDTDRDVQGFNFDIKGDKISKEMKDGVVAEEINIPTTSLYKVDFKYNGEKYTLYRNGEQAIDEADDKEVLATNIIIQFADSKIIGAGGILEIAHIGNGTGKLITNGKAIDINWKKDNSSSKTIFTTQAGDEITLAPGQTWIEVVDSNTNISIK